MKQIKLLSFHVCQFYIQNEFLIRSLYGLNGVLFTTSESDILNSCFSHHFEVWLHFKFNF
jgi:hypothetical protein